MTAPETPLRLRDADWLARHLRSEAMGDSAADVEWLIAEVRALTERAERAEAALAGKCEANPHASVGSPPNRGEFTTEIRADAALGAALREALATVRDGAVLGIFCADEGWGADVTTHNGTVPLRNDHIPTLVAALNVAALLRSSASTTDSGSGT